MAGSGPGVRRGFCAEAAPRSEYGAERGGREPLFRSGPAAVHCRALLADAPVLLLDEATSALDVATERKVLRNVLRAEAHKTVIVTTHRPSVLGICNRVYQIANRQVRTLNQEEIQEKIADF